MVPSGDFQAKAKQNSTAPLGHLPQPPTIARYEKPYGKGKVIVFGIYTDYVLSNPAFLKFFDRLLLNYTRATNLAQQNIIPTQINNPTLRLSISQNKDSTMVADDISKGERFSESGNFRDALKYYSKALQYSNNTFLFIDTGCYKIL